MPHHPIWHFIDAPLPLKFLLLNHVSTLNSSWISTSFTISSEMLLFKSFYMTTWILHLTLIFMSPLILLSNIECWSSILNLESWMLTFNLRSWILNLECWSSILSKVFEFSTSLLPKYPNYHNVDKKKSCSLPEAHLTLPIQCPMFDECDLTASVLADPFHSRTVKQQLITCI